MSHYEFYPVDVFDTMDREEIAGNLGLTVEELFQPLTIKINFPKHPISPDCGYESRILAEQENSGMYD